MPKEKLYTWATVLSFSFSDSHAHALGLKATVAGYSTFLSKDISFLYQLSLKS